MLIWATNQIMLMTIAVFLGLLLGNIRFGRFSFSTSGTMVVGILLGWRVVEFINTIEPTSEMYAVGQHLLSKNIIDKGFFDLFLILFIASVGLLAAKEVGRVIKIYGVKFIFLGIMITFIGAISAYGVSLVSSMDNPYFYNGVYTGALTSSPGLAASLEAARVHSSGLVEKYEVLSCYEKQRILKIIGDDEDLKVENTIALTKEQENNFIRNVEAGVGTGYAVGYPFGVIIVIFAMNFFPVIFKIDIDKEKLLLIEELKGSIKKIDINKQEQNLERRKEVYFDLSAFVLVCLVGYIVGIPKISLSSLGEVSLGSTGGVLIAALVLGHIGKIGPFCFRMNSKILSVLRKITIAYFFAIIGLRYGYQVINSLTGPGLTLVIASILVGSMAMTSGFLVGKYVFKINWIMLSGAICGGMTSTPGLGAAIDAVGSDEPASGYGAVYPFALLGMVIFSNLLNRLV